MESELRAEMAFLNCSGLLHCGTVTVGRSHGRVARIRNFSPFPAGG